MKDRKTDTTQTGEGTVFFDSNILVYAVDERDRRKQKIAGALIANAADVGLGVISTQVLQEFFSVATKKLGLSKEAAKEYVAFFAEQFPVTQVSVPIILGAVDISIRHQLSFWDSLVLCAAHDGGCIAVYSEDLSDGQIVGGVKVLNPFVERAA